MDTLRDRLAELADDAPTGGAPAGELWVRGRRAHRLRTAAASATLLVVVAVGTAIGVGVADGDRDRSDIAAGPTVGFALPIEYPVGEELPDLGATPGPLAAIWLVPRGDGGAPQAVGLVAATGRFGTLPIAVSYDHDGPDPEVALSPDGRRIAYVPLVGELTVRDLVSGDSYSPAFAFETRPGYTWTDATHLVGHVADGSDVEGWVWDALEPGTAPKLVDLRTYPGSPWLGPHAGRDPWFLVQDDINRRCSSPTVHESGRAMLCDVLGVVDANIVLTHWGDEVVALDRADSPFQVPPRRRVVVNAGAPQQVSFASDLIGAALDADGDAS